MTLMFCKGGFRSQLTQFHSELIIAAHSETEVARRSEETHHRIDESFPFALVRRRPFSFLVCFGILQRCTWKPLGEPVEQQQRGEQSEGRQHCSRKAERRNLDGQVETPDNDEERSNAKRYVDPSSEQVRALTLPCLSRERDVSILASCCG